MWSRSLVTSAGGRWVLVSQQAAECWNVPSGGGSCQARALGGQRSAFLQPGRGGGPMRRGVRMGPIPVSTLVVWGVLGPAEGVSVPLTALMELSWLR